MSFLTRFFKYLYINCKYILPEETKKTQFIMVTT